MLRIPVALAALSLASCAVDTHDAPRDAAADSAIEPAVPPALPEPEPVPFPFVLVHGFAALGEQPGELAVDHFFGVSAHLQSLGYDVTAPSLPPLAPSTERALALGDAVDDVIERTGALKVHLIAHSQGGVDARILASTTHADRIASITTISSPHDGTAAADAALAVVPEGALDAAGLVWGALFGVLDETDADHEWSPELAAAVQSLTPSAARALRERYPLPPAEDVPFFTLAGLTNLQRAGDVDDCAGGLWSDLALNERVDDLDVQFAPSNATLGTSASDGLITVASARAAGAGSVFLGCVPADHNDEIGQPLDVVPGLLSGFDHRALYARIAAHARSLE